MKHALLIDKITECIEEVATGNLFETEFLRVGASDLRPLFKKDGWIFIWKSFLKYSERKIYKLVLKEDATLRIQGLISMEELGGFIEVHHAESAPHNRGDYKQYAGIGGNLFAFACRESFERGFEGYTAFVSKTELIEHYQSTLGADLITLKNRRMVIPTEAAKKLVNSYYKGYFNGK
jgi:hypothetical protein